MLAVWQAADDIEVFESGWTFDHFYPIFSDTTGPCLEGWTDPTALAQATKRLRLGTLVTGIHYRHPAVLANMAATLDIISGGRLELGIGAGWNEEESRAYGIELGTPAAQRPLRGGLRGDRRPAQPGDHDLRRQVLPTDRRPQRAQRRCSGPIPRSASAAAGKGGRCAPWPVSPSTGTSWAAPRRSSPASARSCTATARTSAGTRRRSSCPATSYSRGCEGHRRSGRRPG